MSKRKRTEDTFDDLYHNQLDPVSNEYVSSLEHRIKTLESTIAKMKEACSCGGCSKAEEKDAEAHSKKIRGEDGTEGFLSSSSSSSSSSSKETPAWPFAEMQEITFQEAFVKASKVVNDYFRNVKISLSEASFVTREERYILMSSMAMTVDFVGAFQAIYADMDPQKSLNYARSFLFDIARIAGRSDSARFVQNMELDNLQTKIASGPLHFAFTGWALVELLETNTTSPEEFHLLFVHHNSFEADSWLKQKGKQNSCVCAMNAGYSSGWVSQCSNINLTTMEIQCRAKGDPQCLFIMSTPEQIEKHLHSYSQRNPDKNLGQDLQILHPFDFKAREDELRAAMLKAEESDKLKSAFLANVSHEIRTPLNGIMGVASIMLENEMDLRQLTGETKKTQNEEYLDLIFRSGNILLRVINDILDFSKIEANLLEILNVPYSVTDLDLHIRMYIETQLLENGKEIVVKEGFSKQFEGLKFRTDPTRLQQIFNNLVGNALKFTQSPGSLSFGAQFQDVPQSQGRPGTKEIVFYVKDTGIGIPLEKQSVVFERFQQVDSSTSRLHTGTGLGLTITKSLVELLGGQIWLESKLGTGSTFFFSHPYEAPLDDKSHDVNLLGNSSHVSLNFQSPQATQQHRSRSVLLVEDNLVNQQVTELMLKRAGCTVRIASDGSQAVEFFHQEPAFDCIFMDIQMAGMDGMTATKIIREYEGKEGKPRALIIALTANAMRGDMEKYLNAGFDGYLSKPFTKEDLLKMLPST